MSLVIEKFTVHLLTPSQVGSVRRRGQLNQAGRLCMCRACGGPILLGEMRVTGKVGYLNGVTAHIHETCPKERAR